MKAIKLDRNDYVQVTGPDAKTFLQGQVSCNMELLSPKLSLRGVLCNLKGRVIADFRAIQVGESVWLQTMANMGQTLIDVLAKYAVFSKVTLSLHTRHVSAVGLFGDGADSKLAPLLDQNLKQVNAAASTENIIAIRLPSAQARFEIFGLNDTGKQVVSDLLQEIDTATPEEWARLDIEAGIIHIDEKDSEEFTPQLLNYDISGVIDFKKGCYTGQEVVARMFYRGTAKKRLYLLSSPTPIDADDLIETGNKDSRKQSSPLRISNNNDNHQVLAILPTDSTEADTPPTLVKATSAPTTNNSESFLQILTLPYTE